MKALFTLENGEKRTFELDRLNIKTNENGQVLVTDKEEHLNEYQVIRESIEIVVKAMGHRILDVEEFGS